MRDVLHDVGLFVMFELCMIAVAAVIAVGFTGLAVCLIIICCGVVCLRRCF